VTNKGRVLRDVLASFDHYFLQKNQGSCGLISLLQAEGLLRKKATFVLMRRQVRNFET
jgi:hypothetical protein